MSVIIFLIPIALLLSFLGLCAFIWSLQNQQYEDLKGSANRILFEDLDSQKNEDKTNKNEDE